MCVYVCVGADMRVNVLDSQAGRISSLRPAPPEEDKRGWPTRGQHLFTILTTIHTEIQ